MEARVIVMIVIILFLLGIYIVNLLKKAKDAYLDKYEKKINRNIKK